MRKISYIIILALVICLVFAYISSAATYYMGNTGDDFQTLSAAFQTMKGGDTLIIRDGLYEGSSNRIWQFMFPPMGNEGAYTIIKAENNGKVIFSNGANIAMINYPNNDSNNPFRYVLFEGIKWANSVSLYRANHIKFLKCVFEGNVSDGNTTAFSLGDGSSYTLLEDCIAYGKGRYKFLIYRSSKVILRRCIARQDYANMNSPDCDMPIAAFSIYTATDVECQNCIVIDSDTPEFWDPGTIENGGAFYEPNGGNRFALRGCIAINMAMGGGYGSNYDNHWIDSVVWDSTYGIGMTKTGTGTAQHCTIGSLKGGAGIGSGVTASNNIIMNASTAITSASLGGNVLYDNASNGKVVPQDIININPLYNEQTNPSGALKYLVRIESGSELEGAATNSGNIGATILKRIGRSGTLWGEPGWNDITNENLWPWPHEDWIKENMGNYNRGGVDPNLPRGDRGFAAYVSPFGSPNTLTSYIWEYLGNSIPQEIYGGIPLPNNPPVASASASPYSGNPPLMVNFTGSGSDSDGSIISYSWDFGDGNTSNIQNPTYTYAQGGFYTVTLTVMDDDNATASSQIKISISPGKPIHIEN